MTELTTNSGLLRPSKGSLIMKCSNAVYPNGTTFQATADPHCSTNVLGEYCGNKAVLGVVCHLEKLLFVFERPHTCHRAEYLIFVHLRLRVWVVEHSWVEEATLITSALATGKYLSLSAIVGEERLDP